MNPNDDDSVPTVPTVHVVTDSSCDLPAGLADELGIRIVPLTIRFGDEGQRWVLLGVGGFLGHPLGVPEMQRRAGIVWAELQGVHGGQDLTLV